jgi:hypothetical protein
VDGLARKERGEFLQVHRQRTEHRGRTIAEGRLQAAHQLMVTVPARLLVCIDARASQLGRAADVVADLPTGVAD